MNNNDAVIRLSQLFCDFGPDPGRVLVLRYQEPEYVSAWVDPEHASLAIAESLPFLLACLLAATAACTEYITSYLLLLPTF